MFLYDDHLSVVLLRLYVCRNYGLYAFLSFVPCKTRNWRWSWQLGYPDEPVYIWSRHERGDQNLPTRTVLCINWNWRHNPQSATLWVKVRIKNWYILSDQLNFTFSSRSNTDLLYGSCQDCFFFYESSLVQLWLPSYRIDSWRWFKRRGHSDVSHNRNHPVQQCRRILCLWTTPPRNWRLHCVWRNYLRISWSRYRNILMEGISWSWESPAKSCTPSLNDAPCG